jgi:hypothetical protein
LALAILNTHPHVDLRDPIGVRQGDVVNGVRGVGAVLRIEIDRPRVGGGRLPVYAGDGVLLLSIMDAVTTSADATVASSTA